MSEFTPDQLVAIERRRGAFALAAGAGSGKTSVLVERYVRAVVEDGVSPSRVLAITFTDRAAGELRERVRRALIERGRREDARESASAFVSTFHGFCARVLRSHAALAGLASDFAVLTEGTAAALRDESFAAALEAWLEHDGALALAAAYETAALREMVTGAYDELRSGGERVPALPPARPEAGAAEVALLGRLLEAFGEAYARAKQLRGAVDFDDLELEAAALLRHAHLRAAWAERFELIMVDELQDTNARQVALLAALDRDNLFTVGDEHQSIYGFRHADVGIFRERAERLGRDGATGALRVNFRSVAPLLAATGAVFAERFGERFSPLVAGRGGEPAEPVLELLLADRDGWEPHEERLGVELAPAPLWRRAEARLLAARIDRLIAAGTARPEDIVVLLRAATSIGTYEAALTDLGHATLATAGGGFFERPEVIDLVHWLRVLANPLDELALYSVLASPLCGASSGTLAGLAARARERDRTPWELLELEPPDGATRELVARIVRDRELAAQRPLAASIAAAVAQSGYERVLARLHSPDRRIANVRKLEDLARDWERSEGRDLPAFVAALAARRVGAARETEAPPPAAGTGAIRLMTVHAAKGLEFPVVCLADLAHGGGGGDPALLTDGRRVGVRLVTEERERVDALDYAELHAERRTAAAAEEVRIVYVAMTRARERLILSGAARFSNWPSDTTTPISWLGPALIAELPQRAAAGATGTAIVAGAGGVPVSLTLLAASVVEELLGPPAPTREVPALAPHDPAPGEQLTLDLVAPRPAPRAAPAAAAPVLSYSALADYERCGYRYYLERVLGLPEQAAGLAGDDAAERGSAVHALLETLDFARPVILGEDEVARLAAAFAQSPLCARLAVAREVRREAPFAFVLGAGVVRGFLDVAGVEPDGTLLIVDYKTDRVDGDEDLAAHLERDYAIQREIYALAGLRSGAAAVEVAHCFLRRPRELLRVRYEAAQLELLEARVAARVGPLMEGRYEVSPEPGLARCAGCPGRARLCSHDETMTSRVPLVA